MAFGTIPTIVDGDDAIDDFPQAVKVTIDQLAKTKSATELGPDSAGPTVGAGVLTCDTITMPDQGAGTLHAWAHVGYTKSVSSDRFQIALMIDGTTVCTVGEQNVSAWTTASLAASGGKVVAAGARTIDVQLSRVAGTGTATCAAGSAVSLHYIFVPAP